jgi:DNA-binding XRE family transcriptional regulator
MEGNISGDIKKHRERLNLTQEEMADTLGINRKTVGEWESGESTPNKTSRRKLSNLFGVNVTSKGVEKTHVNMKIEKNEPEKPIKNEDDWYRQTIATLIHSNSEVIKINNDTIIEFRNRDKEEIQTLRIDKDKLLDVLTSHFKASQNG